MADRPIRVLVVLTVLSSTAVPGHPPEMHRAVHRPVGRSTWNKSQSRTRTATPASLQLPRINVVMTCMAGEATVRCPDGQGDEEVARRRPTPGDVGDVGGDRWSARVDGPGGYGPDDRPDVVLVVDVVVMAVHDGELLVLLVERTTAGGRPVDRARRGGGTRRDPGGGGRSRPSRTAHWHRRAAGPSRAAAGLRRPDHDPRTRVVSAVHLAVFPYAVTPPGGALASARWWAADAVGRRSGPSLAFDHRAVVSTAVDGLRTRLERTDLATSLVPRAVHPWRPPARLRGRLGCRPRAGELPAQGPRHPGVRRADRRHPHGRHGRPAELFGRGGGAVLHPPMPRPD